jgi:hypothetical protein
VVCGPVCELGYGDEQGQANREENPRRNHGVNKRGVDRKTMDVKQYHRGQRDVDDKTIQRCRRILRKTTGSSQDDSENKTENQQSDVHHGMPRFCRPALMLVLRTGAE